MSFTFGQIPMCVIKYLRGMTRSQSLQVVISSNVVLGVRPINISPLEAFLPLLQLPIETIWSSLPLSNSHGNYLRRTNSDNMLALLLFKYIYMTIQAGSKKSNRLVISVYLSFLIYTPNNPTSQQLLLRYYRVWKLKWNKKSMGKKTMRSKVMVKA